MGICMVLRYEGVGGSKNLNTALRNM
jgi:hypothetical protein